jgi:hypothetical protein
VFKLFLSGSGEANFDRLSEEDNDFFGLRKGRRNSGTGEILLSFEEKLLHDNNLVRYLGRKRNETY